VNDLELGADALCGTTWHVIVGDYKSRQERSTSYYFSTSLTTVDSKIDSGLL
jgi:hypothetical protein